VHRDSWHDDIDVHAHTRVVKPGGDWVRVRSAIRTAYGKASQRLDCALFVDHGSDQRNRFWLSIRSFVAVAQVGIISLFVLAVAILARYAFHLEGAWRWIYVVSAVIALYLNVLVGIVQSFEKVAALKAMAPTQSEPPFVVTQLVALALFIVLAFFAARRFRSEPIRAA
jgi:hypothetical protein